MTAPIEFGAWRKSAFSAADADGPVLVFESGSWSRLLDQLPD